MSKNDITGDRIASKLGGAEAKRRFDENFDRIFGKKNEEAPRHCPACGAELPSHFSGCNSMMEQEGGAK